MTIYVGTKLYGFCEGYFGRDSHEDKIIEEVGRDWIVCRGTNSGLPMIATFEYGREHMEKTIAGWTAESNHV